MNIIQKILKQKAKEVVFLPVETINGPVKIDRNSLHETYATNPYVKIAIDYVANIFSSFTFIVKTKNKNEQKYIEQLLNKPNHIENKNEFKRLLASDLELNGNIYLLKDLRAGDGKPRDLFRCLPHLVEVVSSPNSNEPIQGFKYRAGNKTAYYKSTDIIHIKINSPVNFFYGEPNLLACIKELENYANNKSFNENFLLNVLGYSDFDYCVHRAKIVSEAIQKDFSKEFGLPDLSIELKPTKARGAK